MQIHFQEIRALPGPNIYTHRSALVGLLDLGDLAGRETTDVPGFTDRLLAALPRLGGHHCGLGYAGGFVEQLRGRRTSGTTRPRSTRWPG